VTIPTISLINFADVLRIFHLPLNLNLECIGQALVLRNCDEKHHHNYFELLGDSLLKFVAVIESLLRCLGSCESGNCLVMVEIKHSLICNKRLADVARKEINEHIHYLNLEHNVANPPFLVPLVEKMTSAEWRSQVPFPVEASFSGSIHAESSGKLPKKVTVLRKAGKTYFISEWEKAPADVIEALIGALESIHHRWAYLFLFRLGIISEETLMLIAPQELLYLKPYVKMYKQDGIELCVSDMRIEERLGKCKRLIGHQM
jgi:dsRNA-specific ribonuclease